MIGATTAALVGLCEYWLGSGRFPDAGKQHEAYDADDGFKDPDGWSLDLSGEWWTVGL